MARMRWFDCVAGLSLVLAVGCQTPNGPTYKGPTMPAPKFPESPTSGSQPGAAPKAPTASNPAISDSRLRIGTPAGQGAPAANPAVAKLRPLDSNLAAAPAAPANFNDFQMGQSMNPPAGGKRLDNTNQIAPVQPMTQLPNMMPTRNSAQFAPPAPPAPSFPAAPSFPTASIQPQPNPVDNFAGNGQVPPNLTPPGAARTNIYQPGTVNP